MAKKQMKQQQKARNLVHNAVGTFTSAISAVNHANVILGEAVDADVAEMEVITKQIADSYKRMDVVQADKINKQAEIIQNKELIAKLERFTK